MNKFLRRYKKTLAILLTVVFTFQPVYPVISLTELIQAQEETLSEQELIDQQNQNAEEPAAEETPIEEPAVVEESTPDVVEEQPIEQPVEEVVETPKPETSDPQTSTEGNVNVTAQVVNEQVPAPVTPTWNVSLDGKTVTTNLPVELNKEYTFPTNQNVSVRFTALPANPGTLTIKEVTLSDEQVVELGAFSNTAYEITSTMLDGTFRYDLKLPAPIDKSNIEVKYAESVNELNNVQEVTQTIEKNQNIIKINGLDHFTVFVVADPSASVNNGGGVQNWNDTTFVYTADNNRATVSLNNQTSNYLEATGFNLAIPNGATIEGIEVTIERSVNNDRAVDSRDNSILLIVGGNRVGTDHANTGLDWPATDTVATYGGPSDLWGLTLTAADLNASNFGVAIQAIRATAGNGQTARIDDITITVYYDDTVPFCGNQIVETNEQCDDGNQVDNDLCSNTCQIVGPQAAGDAEIIFYKVLDNVDASDAATPIAPDDTWQMQILNQAGDTVIQTINNYSGSTQSVFDQTGNYDSALVPAGTYRIQEVAQNGYDFAWGRCMDITDAVPGDNSYYFDISSLAETQHAFGPEAANLTPQNGVPGNAWQTVSESYGELTLAADQRVYCVLYNEPVEPSNEITVCKEDTLGNKLSGWMVGLAQLSDSVVVPVDGSTAPSANLPAGDYLVNVTGTYRYGNDQMVADGEYSYRPFGIPGGTNSWVSGDDLYSPYEGYLEVQIDGTNIDWGDFNNAHSYVHQVSGFGGGSMNFGILDDAYGDNLNYDLQVDIYEIVYQGITSDAIQNLGCTTFDDVPDGDYYTFEQTQNGWLFDHFEGAGETNGTNPQEVTLEENETLLFVNQVNPLSDVEVCKIDQNGDPLSNWTMNLSQDQTLLQGTTDQTGCVTFYDVPVGDYTLSEDAQQGWSTVGLTQNANEICSGTQCASQLVTIAQSVEQFTFQNSSNSSVTVCKEDVSGNPLEGWNMTLGDFDEIMTSQIPVDSANGPAGINTPTLDNGTQYLAVVSGTWTNFGGEQVDPFYASNDAWVNQYQYAGNNPPHPLAPWDDRLLKVVLDDSLVNWGIYNSSHTYWTVLNGAGNTANFSIFDSPLSNPSDTGWFGDNVQGNLSLTLYAISDSVTQATDANGCTTFDDVELGDHSLTEEMQTNWSFVTLTDENSQTQIFDGIVDIDESEETFTFVNSLADVIAPDAPLFWVEEDTTEVKIDWKDIIDADSYNIYKDGSLIANVAENINTYTDTVGANEDHEYEVRAVDASSNESIPQAAKYAGTLDIVIDDNEMEGDLNSSGSFSITGAWSGFDINGGAANILQNAVNGENYSTVGASAGQTASWITTNPLNGVYELYVTFICDSSRGNATYEIYNGATLIGTTVIDQSTTDGSTQCGAQDSVSVSGPRWISLGQFSFDTNAEIRLTATQGEVNILADAVGFQFIEDLGSIEGLKLRDDNGNGQIDGADTDNVNRLNNWEITLYDESWNALDSVMTGAGSLTKGQFMFDNLVSGTYYVCETLKNNWMQTYPIAGSIVVDPQNNEQYCYEVDLENGQDVTDLYFGNFRFGVIQGRKYEDVNANGTHQGAATEPLMDGWTINLYDYSWGLPIASMETGDDSTPAGNVADGQYQFEDLVPGTYYVCEVLQDGWAQTGPLLGANPVNINGVQQNDSIAITNLSGNITEGETCWQVVIDESGEQDFWLRFGNFDTAEISGTKFNDENVNGVWDDNESGLEGWSIFIDENDNQDLDGGEISTTTDVDGKYIFEDLLPGTYVVCEDQMEGWQQTYPLENEPAPANCWTIVVSESGQSFADYDFGNTELGFIQGRKFNDVNGDGTFNLVERMEAGNPNRLNGWSIYLYNSDWILEDSMVTGSDNSNTNTDHISGNVGKGQYRFTNLEAGTYYVCEEDRDGWMQTNPNPGVAFDGSESGVDTNCFQIDLEAGEERTGVRFGNFELGVISGLKYSDLDLDGEFDFLCIDLPIDAECETTLEGWTIFIDEDGEKDLDPGETSTTTDVNGNYSFEDLLPGTYSICEVLQDGWFQTEPGNTEEPNCYEITIEESGQVFDGTNFGNVEAATIKVIKVVNDFDGGDIDDSTEFSFNIEGEYKVDGSPFTLTDDGEQTFEVVPGIYNVTEIQDFSGYTFVDCVAEYEGEAIGIPVEFGEQVFLDAGDDVTVTCENRLENPDFTIEKFNDASGPKMPGDVVTFTIIVSANEDEEEIPAIPFALIEPSALSILENVIVTDSMPESFQYNAGSWTATSDTNPFLSVAEPDYSDLPAKWDLQDMLEGETITLTYKATIMGIANPGVYNDVAWAKSTNSFEAPAKLISPLAEGDIILYATAVGDPANVLATNFVGSSVVVASVVTPAGVVLGTSTTVLPNTGADGLWLVLGALGVMIGVMMILYSTTSKRTSSYAKASEDKKVKRLNLLVMPIVFLLSFVMFAGFNKVSAANSDLMVAVENPESPTGNVNLPIDFAALDLQDRTILAECFVQRPSEVAFDPVPFNSVSMSEGGADFCTASASVFSEGSGTYLFQVKISVGSDVKYSNIVSVDFDNVGPSGLTSYSKSSSGTCQYTLNFTTANDGQTNKVEIYRSQSQSFQADATTLRTTMSVSPNQNYNYVDNIPGCSGNYYYALRSVDDAGNASGFASDNVVTVVVAPAVQTTNNQNQIGGTTQTGSVQGQNTTAQNTTTTNQGSDGIDNDNDGDVDEADEGGSVLGDEDDKEDSNSSDDKDSDSDDEEEDDSSNSSNSSSDDNSNENDEEGSNTLPYVIGGFVALLVILGAGYVYSTRPKDE